MTTEHHRRVDAQRLWSKGDRARLAWLRGPEGIAILRIKNRETGKYLTSAGSWAKQGGRMDWKRSALKALKAFAFVILGGVIIGLISPEAQQALNDLSAAVSQAVPYIGPLLASVIKGSLVAGVAAAAHWLENVRKNLNASDPLQK